VLALKCLSPSPSRVSESLEGGDGEKV